ncbi:hypothetical protein E1A91_A13G212000v1 [Gossypium mustelinum]|uniref:NET domain-containing protein n=1 Tax=Gossypium mustelinum TaxID=34275 RepID=A0A5D2WKN8_GOSMU|nr:hypothetical protein E1A91_A13G212000v1 [Gossypium mustelinum]TYJ02215.1 hypothetical protein E1A91_A13G212000v1 [Gossypium mustelinum]
MVKPEPIRHIMTDREKHNLSTKLESLLGELPENIVYFLKEQSSSDGQMGEDEIEIDIDALSHETLFKLGKLLDDYLLKKQKNQAKAESCEIELLNESGFSNSSMQPCKGNDQIDEVVDIVGSSYPPVAIEKELTHRNSRCCSSSGSSGESGFSSSGLYNYTVVNFSFIYLLCLRDLVSSNCCVFEHVVCALLLMKT